MLLSEYETQVESRPPRLAAIYDDKHHSLIIGVGLQDWWDDKDCKPWDGKGLVCVTHRDLECARPQYQRLDIGSYFVFGGVRLQIVDRDFPCRYFVCVKATCWSWAYILARRANEWRWNTNWRLKKTAEIWGLMDWSADGLHWHHLSFLKWFRGKGK